MVSDDLGGLLPILAVNVAVILTVVLAAWPNVAFARTLIRNCPVFDAPVRGAQVVCRLRLGTEVSVGEVKERFVFVEGDACRGFTLDKCLGEPGRAVAGDRNIAYGVTIALGGLWSQVPDAPEASKGADWGVGVSAALDLRAMRIRLMPSFENLSITRTVKASGALSDPGIEATHTGSYFGAEIMGQVPVGDDNWSVDMGAQYLKVLSMTQTTTISEAAVDNSGNLVFAIIGVSLVVPSEPIEFGMSLRYNLATDATHHLYALKFMGGYYF